ncbi:MAG: TldD/PmbA family protein [Phycisphaerales bacterium]|nr:TldD/PmbA family protein [Phycisphaerales bacterium]
MPRRRGITRRDFVRLGAIGAGGVLVGCRGPGSRGAIREGDLEHDSPLSTESLAAIALDRLRRGGCSYGDIRILTTRRETINGRDGRIESVEDSTERGFGVRALYKGAWGFAASPVASPAEVRRVADLAVEVARASGSRIIEPVRLVDEPPHQDRVITPRVENPFDVALRERCDLLLSAMEAMAGQSQIKTTRGSMWAQQDLKHFASTDGAAIDFDLLATHGEIEATAVADDAFASRTFMTPYIREGYERVRGVDWVAQGTRVAQEALEAARAPQIDPGQYDLVLDPANLALTIHESCGHATELDRALGYEANYAGTSFLTPDKLGHFQYGSKHVCLIADNTEPGCLASTGYDDDGVAAQRWDIIREGVFVGYSDNREVAGRVGAKRSHGSSRADSWSSIPIVRIANIGLKPGAGSRDDLIADVKNGILIEGRGSFSIDQRRYNFQFGGDAFWKIENGRIVGRARDVIYRDITPDFWAKCDAVAGPEERGRFGFITCGKGEPGQRGWMTHAASPARFREVEVIRGGAS